MPNFYIRKYENIIQRGMTMRNILGLDNGYNFTKTSKGINFCSTIQKGKEFINNSHQIEVDGEHYIVGEPYGHYTADSDKLKTPQSREIVKVCSQTAIGLSFPHDEIIDLDLVVGCPIAFFSQQKDEMIKLMKELSGEIYIKEIGKKQTINVHEVLAFPQGVGIVFKHASDVKNATSLVIDIGGGTWDVAQFDGLKLTNKATYQEGMLILYEKIAQELNATHGSKFKASDIYSLIERGYFTVFGDKKSMDEVKPIIEGHIDDVKAQIERSFDISSMDNVFLIGGGADSMASYVKKYIPNIHVEKKNQFTNAECFEYMGSLKLRG